MKEKAMMERKTDGKKNDEGKDSDGVKNDCREDSDGGTNRNRERNREDKDAKVV